MPTWSPAISTRLLTADYEAFCQEMGVRGLSASELLREFVLAGLRGRGGMQCAHMPGRQRQMP